MITDIMPFDPFSMFREIDRSFDRQAASRWLPRLDVFDRDTNLIIRVEIAGVDPSDVDVTVEDRTLTISGKRAFDETAGEGGFHRREIFTGEFTRTLVLPAGLDATEVSAKAENGILEVSVPRRPEVLPRKVKVDVSGS
jgi:HSP20 family protein